MNAKVPLVSVVIPAYNCAGTIRQAIDSALKQSLPIEIIVVDDCSSDSLDAAMEPYRQLPEVTLLRNPKNMGAAASRNAGVAAAKGMYVAFLDADDYWSEDKLAKQLHLLQQTDSVLCATARELLTPEGRLTGRVIPVKPEITYSDLLKHNCINCSSVLIKTEVAKAFPMHHDDSHEDYIMWLEVLRKYGHACAVNEPLLKYRLSNTGKSGNKFKSAAMTYRVYRYMGFSHFRSCLLFCRYALNGVLKYALAGNGVKHEA